MAFSPKFVRNTLKFAFLPFSAKDLTTYDTVSNTTPTEQKADKTIVEKETGWDRLKRMYTADEFGNISIEANSILQTGTMSMLFGAVFGGYLYSKEAYTEFIKNNQATSFQHHFEAKRLLQDKVTMGFAKGAFRWSWRLAAFTTVFTGATTMIQVYRGRSGISEYVAAGGIAGFAYKFNLGPRAWIVGSGVGATLGLVCGTLTWGIFKMTGMSMEDIRYWQYYWKDSRNEYFRKGMAEYYAKEEYAVIKIHDNEVGEAGMNINNLDRNIESGKNSGK